MDYRIITQSEDGQLLIWPKGSDEPEALNRSFNFFQSGDVLVPNLGETKYDLSVRARRSNNTLSIVSQPSGLYFSEQIGASFFASNLDIWFKKGIKPDMVVGPLTILLDYMRGFGKEWVFYFDEDEVYVARFVGGSCQEFKVIHQKRREQALYVAALLPRVFQLGLDPENAKVEVVADVDTQEHATYAAEIIAKGSTVRAVSFTQIIGRSELLKNIDDIHYVFRTRRWFVPPWWLLSLLLLGVLAGYYGLWQLDALEKHHRDLARAHRSKPERLMNLSGDLSGASRKYRSRLDQQVERINRAIPEGLRLGIFNYDALNKDVHVTGTILENPSRLIDFAFGLAEAFPSSSKRYKVDYLLDPPYSFTIRCLQEERA